MSGFRRRGLSDYKSSAVAELFVFGGHFMFRKISIMLLMVVFLVGCAEEKVTNLDPNIFAPISLMRQHV